MATLATFFRRPEVLTAPGTSIAEERAERDARVAADQFRLRALPNESVYLFSKKIDNSRLVREADPRARRECWSMIGGACLLIALLTCTLVPTVASTLAGYKLEALKQEQKRLVDERRILDLEEARLLSPSRLEELARGQRLISPAPGQVVHLDPNGDGSVAMNLEHR